MVSIRNYFPALPETTGGWIASGNLGAKWPKPHFEFTAWKCHRIYVWVVFKWHSAQHCVTLDRNRIHTGWIGHNTFALASDISFRSEALHWTLVPLVEFLHVSGDSSAENVLEISWSRVSADLWKHLSIMKDRYGSKWDKRPVIFRVYPCTFGEDNFEPCSYVCLELKSHHEVSGINGGSLYLADATAPCHSSHAKSHQSSTHPRR